MSAPDVYQDMLARTLHAPLGGGLHIVDIRGSEGELALKAAGSDDYFGLIYIGDTAKFKNLVADTEVSITVEEDAISGSMFDQIGRPGTTIETLIGSRKFIEGWNSWRVSNMGLLNIGRNEGSQIIQLFGRGVRLRGRDMTLKRSSSLDGSHPDYVGLLETLNIFAVRANYMAQFRDYLHREGVPTEGLQELPLFIRPNRDFLNKGLVVPRVDDNIDFKADAEVVLQHDKGISKVFMDVSARVQALGSGDAGVEETSASSGGDTIIPSESLELVDWDGVYLDMIEYKERKGMDNLVVRPAALKAIMEPKRCAYQLVAEESLVKPKRAEEWERLQNTVIGILRQYADRLYRHRREQWESNHMAYRTLDETDPNFTFNIGDGSRGKYVVGVPRSEGELIEEIRSLIDDCRALYESDHNSLPRIYFDRHLYQPLLVDVNDKLKLSPPGLVGSERKFINDLRNYWATEGDDRHVGAELFILRNQGKGKGVGFHEDGGFYPDFIMWIKYPDNHQRVVFVEPHGMRLENVYAHDQKAQLHERLPELARQISRRSGQLNVSLDSFIVSATPFEDLHKSYDDGHWDRERFASKHILFPERSDEYDYLEKILQEPRP